MPKDRVIVEGKTTNEAIEKGLKELNVSKNMVNIKVLENQEKRSFFSILAPRIVKVELTLKEERAEKGSGESQKPTTYVKKEKEPVSKEKIDQAKENVKNFLDQFLVKIGSGITYDIKSDDFGLEIAIEGKESGILIGYRGETVYSLQSIISSVANKKSDEKIRVLLDIENYKNKREQTLRELAMKIEKTVERTGKPVKLEPMQAYERKIIHSALQNSTKVKTESIGEEPRRRVVISIK